MKTLKMLIFTAIVATLVLWSIDDVFARGGGGHMGGGGGGHMGGGGWSGGRGEAGRGGEERRGEGRGGDRGDRGGGDRPGRGGEYHGGDHGDHGDHNRPNRNNNNNNNNTTNNVNVTGGGWGGGWGWGAADDALAGMAVGAAIGAAASQPSTIIVEQPAATVVQQTAPAATAYGTQVTQLPGGCTSQNVHGIMAYQCGSTWYRPYFGANGVYYEVVSPPPAEGSVSTVPAEQAQ